MNAAGFTDVEVTDATASFLEVARAWQAEFLRHERELREVMGDEWEVRLSDRAEMIRGVEQGLLRRVFVTGKIQKS
jgi:precorrin-6x reductase